MHVAGEKEMLVKASQSLIGVLTDFTEAPGAVAIVVLPPRHATYQTEQKRGGIRNTLENCRMRLWLTGCGCG